MSRRSARFLGPLAVAGLVVVVAAAFAGASPLAAAISGWDEGATFPGLQLEDPAETPRSSPGPASPEPRATQQPDGDPRHSATPVQPPSGTLETTVGIEFVDYIDTVTATVLTVGDRTVTLDAATDLVGFATGPEPGQLVLIHGWLEAGGTIHAYLIEATPEDAQPGSTPGAAGSGVATISPSPAQTAPPTADSSPSTPTLPAGPAGSPTVGAASTASSGTPDHPPSPTVSPVVPPTDVPGAIETATPATTAVPSRTPSEPPATPLPTRTSVVDRTPVPTHSATATPAATPTATPETQVQFEFSGRVEEVGADDALIDGRLVRFSEGTLFAGFEGQPLAVGQLVQVHGWLQADGSILAYHLELD